MALFDAYIPDILFGEVLLKPQWTQPTLSAQEIRQNSGVPPAPLPVIPEDFTIQLYSPDSQVVVTEKAATSFGSASYSFSMPQYTFRTPSGSALDRSTNDPTADATTPHIKFVWKREGKLSNNLGCYLTGKSTDTNKKKKGGKEPDIAVALLTSYRDLTIYESNLHRVEMEDYKGLEVVLLLSAAAIRDVYCGQRKDCFNVGEAPRKNSGGILGRKKSSPMLAGPSGAPSTQPISQTYSAPPGAGAAMLNNGLPIRPNPYQRRQSVPQIASNVRPPQPLPADPREQWEIDAETTRLKRQAEAEHRAAEARRRERMKAEEAETKRLQKALKAEEKERRRREAEVERETERLRKQYGDQSNLLPATRPPNLPQRQTAPNGHVHHDYNPQRPQPRPSHSGPSLSPYGSSAPPAASQSSFFHGSSSKPKPKKSFLGLRGLSEAQPPLTKKKSSLF